MTTVIFLAMTILAVIALAAAAWVWRAGREIGRLRGEPCPVLRRCPGHRVHHSWRGR